MRIVADENMPFVREACASLGEVITMPGRAMDASSVCDADALLVRSITRVNAELLDESRVRFVGTATIGEDHVDKAYLAGKGIGFSSAPGCNANSVGQYVVAALLELEAALGVELDGMSLGIVGVGNVGKRVLHKAAALGLQCVLNDPPLRDATDDTQYRPLEEICRCDIVTLHVPLTDEKPYPTRHLANETFIRSLKPGAILINTSRGAVVDEAALKRALADGHLRAAVLDVWEDEPLVDTALLEAVFIGTPHIAGYSFDGKINGTRQVYEALCRHFDLEAAWEPSTVAPPPECPRVTVRGDDPEALRKAVRAVYDIRRDAAAMRAILETAPEGRGALFDRLRKEYPRRREFFNTQATVEPESVALRDQLTGLGFA